LPASSISLTTPSYNVDKVCFNIDDLFSQGNNSGWKHEPNNINIPPQYWGVNYTLTNRELYQRGFNYTGVWIKSTNITDKGAGAGQNSGRAVRVYEGRDCDDTKLYYQLTCQTQVGGQCRSAQKSFQSFSLDDAYPFIQATGKCESFAAFNNAASSLYGGASLAVAGMTVLAALWMFL
jgi:hypothetical protein